MGLHTGLTVETTLDPAIQPFLYDHQIDKTPVLPGVMGIEAFAEAAHWLLPDWRVEAIEQVDFLAPFKFYRNTPRKLTIHATFYSKGNDIVASCQLSGSRQLPNQAEPQVTTHFTARVRLTKAPQQVGLTAPVPATTTRPTMEAPDIYRTYFHGPAYQVLERAWRDGNRVVGLMAKDLPPNHQPQEKPILASPRLIELCFQTAGLWEMSVEGRMGLPQHIDQVDFLPASSQTNPTSSSEPRFYAVVTPNGGDGIFSAEVIDSQGRIYVYLRGYRTAALPNSVESEPLKALRMSA
jgi:hypothetical protein